MKAFLAQINQSFERLSAREQLMVVFLVTALLGMLLGFGGYFINRDLRARESRITSKIEKLKEIAQARNDYQARLNEQNRLAEEVKTNNDTRILTYLEELAKNAKIDFSNAAERGGDPTGSDLVKEEAAEVLVKNVSIDRLFQFLNDVELGNRLVVVRRLKIETRFDNKKMLDATITVGTFKSAKEG